MVANFIQIENQYLRKVKQYELEDVFDFGIYNGRKLIEDLVIIWIDRKEVAVNKTTKGIKKH